MTDLRTIVTNPPYGIMTAGEAATALAVAREKPTSAIEVRAISVLALLSANGMAEFTNWRTHAHPQAVSAYVAFMAILQHDGTMRGDIVVDQADGMQALGIVSQATRNAVVELTVDTWPEWQAEGLDRAPSAYLVWEARNR